MIPHEAKSGTSFKGLALYLLQDADKAKSSERVTWTHTVNLYSEAEHAWFEMMETWKDSERLKAANGIPAGNKSRKPVMHYTLAWHPEQHPTEDHMKAAALASLEQLGLAEHEAVIVAHDDKKHPHVHVMANKVHPITGLTAKTLKYSWTKFSKWAQAYELEHGKIYCEERVKNNAARAQASAARAADPDRPYEAVKGRRFLRAHWQDQSDLADQLQEHDASLSRSDAMERAHEALADARAEHREKWAAIYRNQREEATRVGIIEPTGKGSAPVDPDTILTKLTYMRSTFTRADIARELHLRTDSRAAFGKALAAIETHPSLVTLGKDDEGRERLTTREMVEVEQRMMESTHALSSQARFAVNLGDVRKAVRGSILSDEQAGACAAITMGRDLSCVVGYAGTGKSTMLGSAREIWEAAGYRVQGCALSGIAAHGLEGGSGIESRTIHSLEYAWKDGRDLLDAKTVLVVDEAGMIGSRQLDRVLHAARQAGSKVVLVGDQNQLQSIEAGASFRAVENATGSTKITTVRRQNEEWMRDATIELATSQTDKAIERYEAAGMVHAHDTTTDAKAAMLGIWSKAITEHPDKSQIMFAHRNKDVNDLNAQARDHMREAGKLGADQSINAEQGRMDVAIGERIRFTRNNRAMAVMNGTLGTLTAINGNEMTIRLDDNNRLVTFDLHDYNYLDHGYAATVHKAQGVTVQEAHFLVTPGLDRHATYTGLSRHRDSVNMHWSEADFETRDNMIAKLSRENAKDTTLDYAAPRRTEPENALVTEQDRAQYIHDNMERLAAGRTPFTDAELLEMVKSPDALAQQVQAMHSHERGNLAQSQTSRAQDIAKDKLNKRETDQTTDHDQDARKRPTSLKDHLKEQRERQNKRGRRPR